MVFEGIVATWTCIVEVPATLEYDYKAESA